MAKNKNEARTINVFMTYKHDTGGAFLEQVEQMLDKCTKYCEEPTKLNFITDEDRVCVGDDYSTVMEKCYDQTDVNVVLLTENLNTSMWPSVDVCALRSRGVPIFMILCSGKVDSAKPMGLDSGWLDINKITKKDMINVAGKLVKCGQKTDYLSYDRAVKEVEATFKPYVPSVPPVPPQKKTLGQFIKGLFDDAFGKILAILIVLVLLVVLYIIAAKIFGLTGLDELIRDALELFI